MYAGWIFESRNEIKVNGGTGEISQANKMVNDVS